MASINVTDVAGESRSIEITNDLSLMETLREHGYDEILAMCGGCCSCATCHVYIDATNCTDLPAVEEDEKMLMEMEDRYQPERSRLSCQIVLNDSFDGLEVTILEAD